MSADAPWRIVEVELPEGLRTLEAAPGCAGLYVVFWSQGIPLGHREIPASELPLSAARLAALAVESVAPALGACLFERGFDAPLPDLPEPRSEGPELRDLLALDAPLARLPRPPAPRVDRSLSVVICTRDKTAQLETCLRSLHELSRPADEILVVDNAPQTDATRRLVAGMPGLRYVEEPRPGLDVARNTGVRSSKGEVVAFTDDDVRVHPDWTEGLLRGFDAPGAVAVTGLVLPAALETEAQVIFEREWSFNRGYQARTFDTAYFERVRSRGVPVWRIGAGANMAFRREIFDRVGGFDERLDVGAAGCNGDSEFWYRVLAHGGSCRYEPTAVVYHHHRAEAAHLRQQIRAYMRGYVAALLVQFARHRHAGNLRRLFLQLPRYYARLILAELVGPRTPRRHTLRTELAGCLSGASFYLRNRKG